MELEIGRIYLVDHSRKGNFHMKVTAVSKQWIDGVIVDVDENIKEISVTLRVWKSYCTFKELKPAKCIEISINVVTNGILDAATTYYMLPFDKLKEIKNILEKLTRINLQGG